MKKKLYTLERRDIVIVIPLYRSNKINEVLKGLIKKKFKKIIVVDDFCPDNSYQRIEKKIFEKIHILRLKKNLGVGGAVIKGANYSLKKYKNFKALLKFDSDNQHDSADIDNFIHMMNITNCDYVKGNRFLKLKLPKNIPVLRLYGNIILGLLIQITTGFYNIKDPTNGMFLIRKEIINKILKNKNIEKGFLFETSILSTLSKFNAQVEEVQNNIAYNSEKSNLIFYKNLYPFFKKYSIDFFIRLKRDYIFPNLNIGILPLFLCFYFFFTSIFCTIFILKNIIDDIYSSNSELFLFFINAVLFFISFVSWLIIDVNKKKNRPIYFYYEKKT